MKHLIILLFIVFPLVVSAQKISVADFYLDVKDQTANNESTKTVDDNGDVCALIRIQTTEKGFSFDGGTIGIVKADESKTGEIWLYVPAGLRRVSIRHQHFEPLIDYYFPESLQSARTYIMKLVSGTTYTYVEQQVQSQHLIIHVTPENAMVDINNQIYDTENGTAIAFLPFGKYEYHVTARNYHSESGHVVMNDPDHKVEINVSLKPAFGWVEIKGDAITNGAKVYIDDDYAGVVPFKSQPLKSGMHNIRVTKAKYDSWQNNIQIEDEQTFQVTPQIKANFATVTLKTDDDAEIWWNNTMIGKGTCTKDFDCGEHKVEMRKPSHRSQSTILKITPMSQGTINLPSPIPIYGSLNIEEKPVGSQVYVDNILVGTTPLLLQKVLIGQHTIRVCFPGMRSDGREIEIMEGKTETIKGSLSKELNILKEQPSIVDGHCVVSDEYDVLGANLFRECTNLYTINIPITISSIQTAAFYGCYHLESIVIPESVKVIEDKTFYWCAALREISLPEGITTIKDNAFTKCYGLVNITLPSTITSVAKNAFTYCKSLKYIYIPQGKKSFYKKVLPVFLHSKLKEVDKK